MYYVHSLSSPHEIHTHSAQNRCWFESYTSQPFFWSLKFVKIISIYSNYQIGTKVSLDCNMIIKIFNQVHNLSPLKVSKFQNEFMKSSVLPKHELL